MREKTAEKIRNPRKKKHPLPKRRLLRLRPLIVRRAVVPAPVGVDDLDSLRSRHSQTVLDISCNGVFMEIDLRTFTYIDVLQPQLTGFLQTVASGYLPLENQAALFVEIAPGLAINRVTDIALKKTNVTPGMQIVERAYGVLELHSFDQGSVREAGASILDYFGLTDESRLKPIIMSSEIIHGIEGYQSQLINRMRHGQMLLQGDTLYILEVHPAGYAAIAANEAEKQAPINLLEVITFGAFGRLYLGGREAEIEEAAHAVELILGSITGRENKTGPQIN